MLRCYFLLVALVSCAASVASQQVGTTICACSPSVYTFQFDFSYTCNQTTVSIGQGSGIADIDCFSQGLLRPGEDNATVTVTDTTPIRISAVDIIELDQSLAPIASAFYGAGYSNGDTIQYVSIAGNPTNASDLTAEQIPKAIQLSIVGTNAAEEDITNVWIILFDNECGFFEVLTPGDQIGWTNLVSGIRNYYFALLSLKIDTADKMCYVLLTCSHLFFVVDVSSGGSGCAIANRLSVDRAWRDNSSNVISRYYGSVVLCRHNSTSSKSPLSTHYRFLAYAQKDCIQQIHWKRTL